MAPSVNRRGVEEEDLHAENCEQLYRNGPATLLLEGAGALVGGWPRFIGAKLGTRWKYPWREGRAVRNSHGDTDQQARVDEEHVKEANAPIFSPPVHPVAPRIHPYFDQSDAGCQAPDSHDNTLHAIRRAVYCGRRLSFLLTTMPCMPWLTEIGLSFETLPWPSYRC